MISVDTKKKELVGEFKNGGREWQPEGDRSGSTCTTSRTSELGKAIPYGIYDVAANTGWVSVGADHDTSAFAVDTLRRWWAARGQARLSRRRPAADHRRCRRLQRLPRPRLEDRTRPLAAETGLDDHASATCRRAPASGTRSSTGCSPTSP